MKKQHAEVLDLHRIIGLLEDKKICNKNELMDFVNLDRDKIDVALNFLIKYKIVVELKVTNSKLYTAKRYYCLKNVWEKQNV